MSIVPNYVPRDSKTINIFLTVNDGEKALRFYNEAFGAEITQKLVDPNGIIQYAEFKIDDTIIMLYEDKSFSDPRGLTLQIYTGDVEGLYESAIKAGAESISEIEMQFYGDRAGKIADPFGYEWLLATRVETISPNELKARFNNLYV